MSDFHQASCLRDRPAAQQQVYRSTTVDVDVDVDRAACGRLGDGMIYVHVVSTMDLSSKQRAHATLYSVQCTVNTAMVTTYLLRPFALGARPQTSVSAAPTSVTVLLTRALLYFRPCTTHKNARHDRM